MTHHMSRLAALSRPQILVRAARYGVSELNRSRALQRAMPGEAIPAPGKAFDRLLECEVAMNEARCDGGAAYSPARHVELLSALINEAKLAENRLPN